jgi:DNA-binding XRE family transcriptional regulator
VPHPHLGVRRKRDYRSAASAIVREGRARLQLTQAQMATAVQLSQGEISRIERNKVETPLWLFMYLVHLFPDLAIRSSVSELRLAAVQAIQEMPEIRLRAVMPTIQTLSAPRGPRKGRRVVDSL